MSGTEERVGLCADCAHASVQLSAKGSEFWRCRAADREPGMLRYPPLPVRSCGAHSNRESGKPSRESEKPNGEPEKRGEA